MDTTTLITLIVAVIAIIPGVYAVVKQMNRDKEVQLEHVSHFTSVLSDELYEVKKKVYDLHKDTKYNAQILSEDLFKKMYEKPVIIRCEYCNSGNVISNTECIKCGAQLGD